MVGVHHVKVPGVCGEEFVAADCTVLVAVGHLQHHHAAAMSAAMTAGLAIGTAVRRTALVRRHEFIAGQSAVMVGVGPVELLAFVCSAIGTIEFTVVVGVHFAEHCRAPGLKFGLGYSFVAQRIAARHGCGGIGTARKTQREQRQADQ